MLAGTVNWKYTSGAESRNVSTCTCIILQREHESNNERFDCFTETSEDYRQITENWNTQSAKND